MIELRYGLRQVMVAMGVSASGMRSSFPLVVQMAGMVGMVGMCWLELILRSVACVVSGKGGYIGQKPVKKD